MKKSIRLIILFASIAALFGVFFILTDRGKNRVEAAPEPAAEVIRITDLEEESVERIEVAGNQESLLIVRTDGEWMLDPEPDFPILPATLEEIERSIRTLTAERVVAESAEDLDVYGLAVPRVSVTALLGDGSTLVVHIGESTPSKQAFYLRKEGDERIFTVRNYLVQPLFYSLNDLRPDRLTYIDKEQITYIYVKGAREMEIIPIDREQFKLVAPFSAFMMTKPWSQPRGTDAEKMQSFLDAIPFYLPGSGLRAR